MKHLILAISILFVQQSIAQDNLKHITEAEVTRIETILSSDDMEGRKIMTPGIEKAANFIASEFKKAGLSQIENVKGYKQTFGIYTPKVTEANLQVGSDKVDGSAIHCVTTEANIKLSGSNSNYKIFSMVAGDNPMSQYRSFLAYDGNVIILMDTSHSTYFNRLKQFGRPVMSGAKTQIIILTSQPKAQQIAGNIQVNLNESSLSNVVGVIPGKSKKNEFVIFSGHYDHLGYGRPNEKGDSLYNGANDDASGTTAVIALANYFKKLNNNERTLIFAAFTAEESGGYGSQYFSRQLNPADIAAMFNIEMIGTDSKWGNNSAYITGYDKTDMGTILEKNLEGTAFKFYPDPYTKQNLFYRSDNATLARLGVPAHTISTSKMDSEPHYHKASDEIGTLDMKNMTEVIKAIALSSRSIIAGTDSPSRVDASQLNR